MPVSTFLEKDDIKSVTVFLTFMNISVEVLQTHPIFEVGLEMDFSFERLCNFYNIKNWSQQNVYIMLH